MNTTKQINRDVTLVESDGSGYWSLDELFCNSDDTIMENNIDALGKRMATLEVIESQCLGTWVEMREAVVSIEETQNTPEQVKVEFDVKVEFEECFCGNETCNIYPHCYTGQNGW